MHTTYQAWNMKKRENQNLLITSKEIESVIKNLQ